VTCRKNQPGQQQVRRVRQPDPQHLPATKEYHTPRVRLWHMVRLRRPSTCVSTFCSGLRVQGCCCHLLSSKLIIGDSQRG
jgi:hypothetical protein